MNGIVSKNGPEQLESPFLAALFRGISTSCLRAAVCSFLIILAFMVHHAGPVYADEQVLDRIVAVVDDDIVMLSEVQRSFYEAQQSGLDVTEEETLNGLVNRILLLNQAKKIRKKHIYSVYTEQDNNVLIHEYLQKRVREFIRISLQDIEDFYNKNREFFDQEFSVVRDEIERYLINVEFNRRVLEHIEELRTRSYIRIQLKE